MSFRHLALLNKWDQRLVKQSKLCDDQTYLKIIYKCFIKEDHLKRLSSTKLIAGGLFSCVKVWRGWVVAGMLDGLIKLWSLSDVESRKPLRLFVGHEESVSCLDARDQVLVSGSMDRSVRVWSLETANLLRVLRSEGSPVERIKLLSDRLLWWSRSGAFNISSWRDSTKVEHKCKFNINEDPLTCIMDISEDYIVTNQTDADLDRRDVVVYCSRTGMRLFEKDIFSSKDIHCLSVEGHMLFIGSGNSLELWDLNMSSCLAIIQSSVHNSFIVKDVCVSDFLVVAMLSNSEIICLPLTSIMDEVVLSRSETAVINWNTRGFQIENKELAWRSMTMSDDHLVFGLEKRLGDIKIFSFRWNFDDEEANNKVLRERKYSLQDFHYDIDLE